MNVLVIDDDAVASNFLAMQLKMLGKTPQLANSGAKGIELVESLAPLLILLDCQMPEMDGFETARALRAGGYAGPIVGLTAEDDATIRDRCLAAGMTEYERKPIDVARLKGVLEKFLRSGRDPLAKCRAIAEKSGFPALAKKMAEGFVKSTDEALARNDLAVLAGVRDGAVNFGAEDFAEDVARGIAAGDLAGVQASWQSCRQILLSA